MAREEVVDAVQAEMIQELRLHRRPVLGMSVHRESRAAADGRVGREVRAEVLGVVKLPFERQLDEEARHGALGRLWACRGG